MLSENEEMGFAKKIFPIFLKMTLKLFIFVDFLLIKQKCAKNAISDAQDFLKMQNYHFFNIGFTVKKIQICCIFFIWLAVMCNLYIKLRKYKKVVGVAVCS